MLYKNYWPSAEKQELSDDDVVKRAWEDCIEELKEIGEWDILRQLAEDEICRLSDMSWTLIESRLGFGELPIAMKEFYSRKMIPTELTLSRTPHSHVWPTPRYNIYWSHMYFLSLKDSLQKFEKLEHSEVDGQVLRQIGEPNIETGSDDIFKKGSVHGGWIPVMIADSDSNEYICMDCNPGPKGKRFQILWVRPQVEYLRSYTVTVVADTWSDFVKILLMGKDAPVPWRKSSSPLQITMSI